MRATVALLGLCAGAANAATTGLTVTADNSVYCSTYASTPTNIVTNPSLVKPQDVAVDGNGDVFVVDSLRQELIRIGTDHTSSVLLGPKYLQVPVGLTISPIHADLYIGDENTSTIWHLACQTRNKNYCAQYYNTPLNLSLATNVHPFGLSMDMDDHLYIADMNGQRVIKRDVTTGVSSVLISVASMGALAPSKAFNPHDIAIDPNTNELLVTDVTNDDIWTLQCKTPSSTGLSCSV
jgi:DNA-binding beta-propeller fold protein YncE